MIIESKVIELFCMSNHFRIFIDIMMVKYTLKSIIKRIYYHASTM